MTYAHIFKARGKFQLLLTSSSDIAQGETVTPMTFDTKKQAKDHAKSVGAKAWNY